jgi:predicted MFS family arabinose efflux permease
MSSVASHPPVNERAVVLLIAAIHFINILDFMIVMPLGPQFARELGIPSNHIGDIAGAYTAAAALSGIAGSFFLDRFDRRKALAVSLAGLIVGTALGGFAWDLPSLIGARVVAGMFGGPAMAVALAVISDVVPVKRRGRAMGTVMTAFSIASIAGVPIALEIANAGGWRAPFFAVAGLGLVLAAASVFLLPSLKLHLVAGTKPPGVAMFGLLTKPLPLLAYGAMMAMMFSAFTIIPHIPGYVEFNLGYKGEAWLTAILTDLFDYQQSVLGPLYLVGGILSLIVLQIVGRLTDRIGSATVRWVGGALVIGVIYFWFIDYNPAVPVMLLFVAFMGSMSVRGVPARALDTKIPLPHERAAFMSLQSSVQHFSLAAAAVLSSRVLTENETDKSLSGMATMAAIAIGFAVLLPLFVTLAERALKRRDAFIAAADKAAVPAPAGAPVTAPVSVRAAAVAEK